MNTNLVLYPASPNPSDLVLADSSRPVAVQGSAAGQAVVSADISKLVGGGGVTTGSSSVMASLQYAAALGATVEADASVEGECGVIHALSGVSEGKAAISAEPEARYALEAAVTGTADVRAPLGVIRPLAGTAAGSSGVDADLLRARLFDARASGGAHVDGALDVVVGFAVTVAASAAVESRMSVAFALSETIGGTSSLTATLLSVEHFVAEVVARATVSGLLARHRGLGGTVRGVAQVQPSTLYAPTIITTGLIGSRDGRMGAVRAVTDLQLVGVRSTRTRVGTLQVVGGSALAGGAASSRARVGTAQATVVDVTVVTAGIAGVRSRGSASQAQNSRITRPAGVRTRVGTLATHVYDAVVARLAGLRSRGGTLAVVVEAHDPPSNDEIAGAIELDPTGGSMAFDTTYASANAFEPAWPDAAPQRSLWYLYTAPADGVVRIFTGPTNGGTGPYIATRLGLYSSPALDDFDYGDLTAIATTAASASYDPQGAASFIAQSVLAGQFFWVRIDSASSVRYSDLDDDEVAEYGVGPGTLGWEFVPSEIVPWGAPAGSELDGIIAPGNLVITVGNLPPGVTVQFVVDSDDVADVVDSLDVPDIGALVDASVWLPNPLAEGGHILYGIVNGAVAFTIPFVVVSDPALDVDDGSVKPVLIPRQGVLRWVFQDPTGTVIPGGTSSSWIVPLNPKQMNTPLRTRQVTSGSFVGVGGDAVVWEADGEIPELTFSGTILDGNPSDPTSHLSMLQYFADLSYTIYIIDHFNRAWTVYIESFDPVPSGSSQHPFRHTYTMKALALKPPLQLSTLGDEGQPGDDTLATTNGDVA